MYIRVRRPVVSRGPERVYIITCPRRGGREIRLIRKKTDGRRVRPHAVTDSYDFWVSEPGRPVKGGRVSGRRVSTKEFVFKRKITETVGEILYKKKKRPLNRHITC